MTFKHLALIVESTQATKQMKRVERALKDLFKKELKLSGKLSMTVKSQFEAEYEFSHDRVIDDKTFDAIIKDAEATLRAADEEGHFHSVIDGSSNPAEVLLYSLRPGMTVKAEAFFPTIAFTIKWKQIVSRK